VEKVATETLEHRLHCSCDRYDLTSSTCAHTHALHDALPASQVSQAELFLGLTHQCERAARLVLLDDEQLAIEVPDLKVRWGCVRVGAGAIGTGETQKRYGELWD